MSMTIEEAIKYFANMTKDKTALSVAKKTGSPKMVDVVKQIYEANELAITALREKAERDNPAPLTIEELRQMDGEPVYVSDLQRPKESEYCIIHANDKYGHGDENRSAQISGCECFWYDFETYGDTWIAYRHKPKEETHG